MYTIYIFASVQFRPWIKGNWLWLFSRLHLKSDSASLRTLRWLKTFFFIGSYLGKPVCFIGQPDHDCNYKKNIALETPQEDSISANRFYLEIWTQTQMRKNTAGVPVSLTVYKMH